MLGLLRWYADMGVDLGIDEAPHDRFADAEHSKAERTAPSAAIPSRSSGPSEPQSPTRSQSGQKLSLTSPGLLQAQSSPPPPDQAALLLI